MGHLAVYSYLPNKCVLFNFGLHEIKNFPRLQPIRKLQFSETQKIFTNDHFILTNFPPYTFIREVISWKILIDTDFIFT